MNLEIRNFFSNPSIFLKKTNNLINYINLLIDEIDFKTTELSPSLLNLLNSYFPKNIVINKIKIKNKDTIFYEKLNRYLSTKNDKLLENNFNHLLIKYIFILLLLKEIDDIEYNKLKNIINVPHIPGSTTVPHIPGSTTVPHLPGSTTVPHLPGSTTVPHLPGSTTVPHLPGSTTVPHLPGSTTVPHLPGSTTVPHLPGSTTVPHLPGSTTVPHLPGSTDVPYIPINSNDTIIKSINRYIDGFSLDELLIIPSFMKDKIEYMSYLKDDVGISKDDVGISKDDVGISKDDVGISKDDVCISKNGNNGIFFPRTMESQTSNMFFNQKKKFYNIITDYVSNDTIFNNNNKNEIFNFQYLVNTFFNKYIDEYSESRGRHDIKFIYKGGTVMQIIYRKYKKIIDNISIDSFSKFFSRSDSDYQIYINKTDDMTKEEYYDYYYDINVISYNILYYIKLFINQNIYSNSILPYNKINLTNLKNVLDTINNKLNLERDTFTSFNDVDKFVGISINGISYFKNDIYRNQNYKYTIREDVIYNNDVKNNKKNGPLSNKSRDFYITFKKDETDTYQPYLVYINSDDNTNNGLYNYYNETNKFDINNNNLINNFILHRIKINTILYFKSKSILGTVYYGTLKIPSELIDVSISKYNDHKINNFDLNIYVKKYNYTNVSTNLEFNSYTLDGFIDNLYKALIEVKYVWKIDKYEKKINRYLFLMFILTLNKYDIVHSIFIYKEILNFINISSAHTKRDINGNILIPLSLAVLIRDSNYLILFINLIKTHKKYYFYFKNDMISDDKSNIQEYNNFINIIIKNIKLLLKTVIIKKMFNKIKYNYYSTPPIFNEKLILKYMFIVGISLIELNINDDDNNFELVNIYFNKLKSYIMSSSIKPNIDNEFANDLILIVDLYKSTSQINLFTLGINLFTIPTDKYLLLISNTNNIKYIETYYNINHINKKEDYSNNFLLYIAKILLLSIKKYDKEILLQICTKLFYFTKSIKENIYINDIPSLQRYFNKFLEDNNNIFIDTIIDYKLQYTEDIFKNLINILYKHVLCFTTEYRNQSNHPSISLLINRYKFTINIYKGMIDSFINCINSNNISDFIEKTNYDDDNESIPYLKKYLKYKEKYSKYKEEYLKINN